MGVWSTNTVSNSSRILSRCAGNRPSPDHYDHGTYSAVLSGRGENRVGQPAEIQGCVMALRTCVVRIASRAPGRCELRFRQASLDEAEHFLRNRDAGVATLRWCSGSSRFLRSASPESPVQTQIRSLTGKSRERLVSLSEDSHVRFATRHGVERQPRIAARGAVSGASRFSGWSPLPDS